MIQERQGMLKLMAALTMLTGLGIGAHAQDAGGASLTINGTGTGTFSGGSSYSGGTTLSSGTISFNGGGDFGGAVFTTGGTLSGTITPTGVNLYQGDTTISDGTITVTGGSLIQGVTAVSPGTILVNSGTLTGGATDLGVSSGGTFTVTDTTYEPTNFTLDTGSKLDIFLDSLNSTAETLNVNGNITLDDPSLTVTDTTTGPITDGTTFTLIHYTGSESGEFEINDVAIPDGGTFALDGTTFAINYDSGDPNITITAVPEPSAVVMLAGSVCLVAFWRRGKRIAS